ncbi:16S rRNA m(5)C 967 methyltransferase [Giardia duodenalis]|uniref:16S rRNA m(5)C 967 methyltransferase n=1 Tax=Giardia intestinalis TaxID=5741 RepID=V6TYG5_GIAIN|nr:16S rRNA m(5)C 967 methyltransferase [Giardia intestinalis]
MQRSKRIADTTDIMSVRRSNHVSEGLSKRLEAEMLMVFLNILERDAPNAPTFRDGDQDVFSETLSREKMSFHLNCFLSNIVFDRGQSQSFGLLKYRTDVPAAKGCKKVTNI